MMLNLLKREELLICWHERLVALKYFSHCRVYIFCSTPGSKSRDRMSSKRCLRPQPHQPLEQSKVESTVL